MKGIFEFKIGDVERGFKFGTYAFAIACDKDKCNLTELQIRCGLSKKNGEKIEVNLLSLLRLFYGAAVHYAEHKKQKIDFSEADVSDWTDELGLEKVQEILALGLSSYQPKNSSSPKETGIPA